MLCGVEILKDDRRFKPVHHGGAGSPDTWLGYGAIGNTQKVSVQWWKSIARRATILFPSGLRYRECLLPQATALRGGGIQIPTLHVR